MKFVERSRKIWRDVQSFLAQGIADGSCRQGDIEALTEVAAGTFAWIARKNEPSAADAAWKAADAICDIMGFGILSDQCKQTPSDQSPT